MNSRQLLFIAGASFLMAGFFYFKSAKTSKNKIDISEPDNTDFPILSTIKRIWQNIPVAAAPYIDALKRAESSYSLPPTLLTRMAYIESGFSSSAYNPKSGATGILQIIPKYHANVDAKNPYDSINYAGAYLKDLYNKLGSWEKAIAAYNWGIGNVTKAVQMHGADWLNFAPTETRNYVANVKAVIDLPA